MPSRTGADKAFRSDLPSAVLLCEDVRQTCEDHGERWARAYALQGLGYAAWVEGDFEHARTLLEEALAIHYSFRDLIGSVLAIELLALVTMAEGEPVEAAELHGVASRIVLSVGLPLLDSGRFNALHALCEDLARGRLGHERYEKHLHAGARLGMEKIMARVPTPPRHTELPARHKPTPDAR